MSNNELELQIAQTIRALEHKQSQNSESAVANILVKYRKAQVEMEGADGVQANKDALGALLNCARGYLETSSNWEQEFLHQMGRTEKLIKDLGLG